MPTSSAVTSVSRVPYSVRALAVGCVALGCSAEAATSPIDGEGGSVANNSGGSSSSAGGTSSTAGGAVSSGGNQSNGGTTGTTGTGGNSTAGGTTGAGGTTTSAGGSSAGTAGTSSGGRTGGSGGTAGAAAGGRSAGGTTASSGGASSGGRASGGASSGGSGSGGTTGACTATGFYVQNGMLMDSKCKEFVMRGVNYPYAWFTSRNAQQDLTAIAATGANTVRITMATGGRWTKTTAANLTTLINAAKAAKLVSVVEVHDTTGYSEQAGSVPLSNATSYWTGSDIANVLKGQEAFVIVNVANEPNGNNTASTWASTHVTSVQALRNAGYNHTLMVDGPGWGQDWQNAMRDGGGASIWNADSKKNMLFSVHMYDVYETAATISSYFNTFLAKYEAPLVVGEFASDHGSAGNVDEATIMSLAENLGIGYLGWSWSGNASDLATLNITNNFNASSLTTWGTRLISGDNGIKATSTLCTCFN
ncbi:MAG: glycoside hydrolase family 5 protein [Polyangiaceae bacterium]